MCEINALATATGEGNVFCSFKLTLLNKKQTSMPSMFLMYFLYHESELVNNITILDVLTKRFITQTTLLYVP